MELDETTEGEATGEAVAELDVDNQDGKRPEWVVVKLLADGHMIDYKFVTADEKDHWIYAFNQVRRYAEDGITEVEYTVMQTKVEDYITTVSGTFIINEHTPELITVDGKICWDDEDNQDGIRPNTVHVKVRNTH